MLHTAVHWWWVRGRWNGCARVEWDWGIGYNAQRIRCKKDLLYTLHVCLSHDPVPHHVTMLTTCRRGCLYMLAYYVTDMALLCVSGARVARRGLELTLETWNVPSATKTLYRNAPSVACDQPMLFNNQPALSYCFCLCIMWSGHINSLCTLNSLHVIKLYTYVYYLNFMSLTALFFKLDSITQLAGSVKL